MSGGAFNDWLSRPPGWWRKVAAVVLAILLPLALWDKRGIIVGVLAFIIYGGVLLVAAFDHRRTTAWSRRHVGLDSAVIVPLTFLALAYLTDLALVVCLAIAFAAGAVLVPVALSRHSGGTTA